MTEKANTEFRISLKCLMNGLGKCSQVEHVLVDRLTQFMSVDLQEAKVLLVSSSTSMILTVHLAKNHIYAMLLVSILDACVF